MSLTTDQTLWIELACTPKMRPHYVKAISAEFYSIADLFDSDHMTIAGRCQLPAELALNITSRAGKEKATAECKWITEHKIAVTTFADENYPELLREIHDPPPVLYSYGYFQTIHNNCVSIVGSRSCTSYGSQAAYSFARELAGAGITIVSGMAWGIDQAAHKGALEAGGATLAIIGSGLNNIYPNGTEKLVQQISERGVVATEFLHSVPPDKSTFPQRNRIVSGISPLTVVIEASQRSGALITARLANEQGRDVLALPGSIFAKRSEGTNRLIQQGAKLIRDVNDIIDELPQHILESTLEKQVEKGPSIELTAEESRVMELLSVDTPLHIDIIARQLDMNSSELSVSLLQMEINGIVHQLPGMKFIKKV